jgi:hypothetical protein
MKNISYVFFMDAHGLLGFLIKTVVLCGCVPSPVGKT